jgi:hypothetical protein
VRLLLVQSRATMQAAARAPSLLSGVWFGKTLPQRSRPLEALALRRPRFLSSSSSSSYRKLLFHLNRIHHLPLHIFISRIIARLKEFPAAPNFFHHLLKTSMRIAEDARRILI